MTDILIVDIETTGFQDRGGLIVEVGIVKLNLNTGNTTKVYDELVKEKGLSEKQRDSWIFKNSDLSFDAVLNAKPLDIDTLQFLFDSYPATAYNKNFDFDFLRSRGLKINDLPCPMIIATNICKIPSPYGYKYPKVQELWDHLFGDTGYIEKHRGADDAEHEAQMVFELYKKGHFKLND